MNLLNRSGIFIKTTNFPTSIFRERVSSTVRKMCNLFIMQTNLCDYMSSSGFWEAWVGIYGTKFGVVICIYMNACPNEKIDKHN